jgi:hypothetical protein
VPEYADIPACGEGGFPFIAVSWVGVFAPAKVDETIAAKLNAAINEIVAEPPSVAKLRTFSMQTSVHSLADTERCFRSEVAKRGQMVEAIGIVAKGFRCTQPMEPLENGRVEFAGASNCCPPKPKHAMRRLSWTSASVFTFSL